MEPFTENFDEMLKRLLASVPEAKGAAIFSMEGYPITSALPRGVNDSKIAALLSALHSLAKLSMSEMKNGVLGELYIISSKGNVLVRQAGPNSVLAISTPQYVNLGNVSLGSNPKILPAVHAYKKIISEMKKESVDKLSLGRRYLPEIFNLDILEISDDGLPSLKPFALKYLTFKGIKTKLYGNVVKFSQPHLKIIARKKN